MPLHPNANSEIHLPLSLFQQLFIACSQGGTCLWKCIEAMLKWELKFPGNREEVGKVVSPCSDPGCASVDV